MDERPLRRVGEYEILRELGRGGMGVVHLASVEGPVPGAPVGERVALKVIWPHLVEDPDVFERFVQEASLGRSIRHENVVRTLDAGMDVRDDGETVYLVMEHVVGRTLAAVRAETGRVPEGLCRRVARDVARALVGIHAAGVVHGDLKPENVLLTADEVVKVMDLGLARLRDRARRDSGRAGFAGSFLYAAPEQYAERQDAVDGRADLYALGVTLYELASGRHPFAHDDARVVMHRHVHETAAPLCEANSSVSPFLSGVVGCLMEKDPARRFRSAAELFAVLARAEESRWWRSRGRPECRVRVHPTDLHGREVELAELRRLHADARRGSGHAVLVIGEAGIGRTRLVDEFRALASSAGGDDDVTVVEDLHASDDETRRRFLEQARDASVRRRLLVGTARPTLEARWRLDLASIAGASEVVLARLSREAIGVLVEEAVESGPSPPALVEWIAARSDGNPFVAVALVHDLRDAGLLAAPPADRPLPQAVRSMMTARLASLAPDDRDVVDAASCLGHEFGVEDLAELTGLDRRAAHRRLAEIEDGAGIVRSRRGRFAFDSHALWRTVHDATQPMLRLEYHRMAAASLAARGDASGATAAEICRHAFLADAATVAAPYVESALAHLDAAGRFDEAASLAERALASPGLLEGRVRTDVRTRLAMALVALGRSDDARAALRSSLGN